MLGTRAPVPALALALLTLMLPAGKDPCSLPNPATVNPKLLLLPTCRDQELCPSSEQTTALVSDHLI